MSWRADLQADDHPTLVYDGKTLRLRMRANWYLAQTKSFAVCNEHTSKSVLTKSIAISVADPGSITAMNQCLLYLGAPKIFYRWSSLPQELRLRVVDDAVIVSSVITCSDHYTVMKKSAWLCFLQTRHAWPEIKRCTTPTSFKLHCRETWRQPFTWPFPEAKTQPVS